MKKFLALILTSALIFTLGGCKNDPSDIEDNSTGFEEFDSSVKEGGTVDAYMLRPDTLNPLLTGTDINRRMLALCFDPLFSLDASFRPIPRLAESCTLGNEGKRLTVKLKRDVTWHDGSSFTSADVVYTVNSIKTLEGSYYHSVINGLIEHARAIDSSTVEFTLAYADSGAASLLTFPILKKTTGNMSAGAEEYLPMGTGAFSVQDYTPESALRLVRNDDWQCGKVYIDGVNLNILPDEDAVFSAFNSGLIDFVKITKENAGRFSVSADVKYLPAYTEYYTYIGLNCENALLAQPRVRTILSASLDRNAFSELILSGYGEGTDLPVHPKAYYFTAEKSQSDFDKIIESTDNLTHEQGKLIFTEEDSSHLLSFTLLINSENPSDATKADYIAETMGGRGITVTVLPVDYQTYVQRISQGDFEMYLGKTRLSADVNLHPMLGASGQLNFGKFSDSKLENITNNILSSTDSGKRAEEIRNMQKEFRSKAPHIPLYFENEMIVYNSKKIGHVSPVTADNLCDFVTGCAINK